jgi:hypothetical protein
MENKKSEKKQRGKYTQTAGMKKIMPLLCCIEVTYFKRQFS